MANPNTPIPQSPIGENFQWRDWFQRLSNRVYGTLASQDSSGVAISGGTIDNTAIGSKTPSTGSFTSLKLGAPLDVEYGGTNGFAIPRAGAVAYGNGGAYAFTSVGTSGQVLTSRGSAAPVWSAAATGTVTSITAGTGLSGGVITTSGTIALANTAVTAGSYSNATFTVNAQGQITAASSGGSSMVYPGAGIANSTGSAWATSYSTSGSGTVVPLATGATLNNPTISNYATFTAASAPTYTAGRLWYDTNQNALAYYNDVTNNTLHIGEEIQLKVYNNTGSTINIGQPVYVTSTSSGYTYPNVALAIANSLTTGNVIGLANQNIPTGTAGYVTTIGLVQGLNTGTYTVGDTLYLSPYSAGYFQNTIPPTGYAIKLGTVAYVNSSNGAIYVNKSILSVQAGNIVGQVPVANGGTGASTLTGYVYGNGTSAMTASTTIPTTALSGTVTNAQLANSSVTFNGVSVSLGSSGSITAANPYALTIGTGLSGSSYIGSSAVTIALANTTVSAGSYTYASLTVDAQGRLTAASNGTAPVTSVAATAPIASSGGTTPTISISQATTSTNGYLSSTDWNTFNNKQPAGTYVTSVSGTAPVVSSGGTTPAISMAAANGSTNGYLTSTDWTTFNNKQPAGTYVTSVSVASSNGFAGTSSGGATPSLTLSTSITGLLYGNGTALAAATISSPLAYSAGTLSINQSNTSTNGYLSSTDWNTFNNKQAVSTPVTISASTYSVGTTDLWLINNYAGTCTLTLPTASSYSGRVLNVQNYQAYTVVSASSNVVSISGGSAGTAILNAIAGDRCTLVSNGTNWLITDYTPNNILLLN